jgi:antitoxin component YwqK of YwqJK toxin-antitoxin module
MKKLFFICLFWAITSGINVQAQTYEIVGKDTVNMLDIHNYKIGKWIVRGHNKHPACKNPTRVIEMGYYVNNRKEGEWIEYYCNGKMRNKLTYKNGVLEGPATLFNTDGSVLKEGAFQNNKWVHQ